jgi:hypothetical protein
MPMYPEIMVIPMREELTRLGIEELRTADDVDRALESRPGTAMVVVNSICGCAAGRMRPAVRMALENSTRPDKSFLYLPDRIPRLQNALAVILQGKRRLRRRLRSCRMGNSPT